MKKLMAAAAVAACGVALAVESSNIVGYAGNGVAAQEWNLVGLPFVDVGGSNGIAFDKILSMANVPAVSYDDASAGLGAELQVRDELGGYTSYYYINDAENKDGDYVTGWADGDGYLLDGTTKLDSGSGVWLRLASATGVSFTFSGEVESAQSVDGDFINGWTIMSSPYPVMLNLGNVTTEGVSAVSYDDAFAGLGAEIQVRDAQGLYTSYYYINDAENTNGDYVTGWADGDGYLVNTGVIPLGSAFWMRSPSAGTLVFSL